MSSRVSRPFRLTVYTDAYELGGAEQSVRNLLANLGDHASVSVLGVDRDVVDWIASARPGTEIRVVRPVRGKLDLGPVIDHARAIRELRPDIFHANLRTTFACRYGILAALLTPGVRVVVVRPEQHVGQEEHQEDREVEIGRAGKQQRSEYRDVAQDRDLDGLDRRRRVQLGVLREDPQGTGSW